tara:strand:+ start:16705 stop:16866 length:162 start_codon:yes stop_codon:yes gene_type:complete
MLFESDPRQLTTPFKVDLMMVMTGFDLIDFRSYYFVSFRNFRGSQSLRKNVSG